MRTISTTPTQQICVLGTASFARPARSCPRVPHPIHGETTLKTKALRGLLAAAAALVVCAPAAPAQTTGDSVSSDNVEFVKNLREVGDGVGATIIPELNRMFVTSTTHLTIYDITDAENPVRVGLFSLNVEFENEEVPTNGKLLGISADTFCVVPDATNPGAVTNSGTSCLSIYDVSDPENVKLLSNVPDGGNHTATCVLDCQYFFGSEGTVVDARDPANAKIVDFNWESYLAETYSLETKASCHHQREIQPGILLASCNPVVIFSVRPEDGASITSPVILSIGTAEDPTLIHSSRWPRQGKDKFVLVGQETNAQPQCTDAAAAFQTWDASKARASSTPFSFPKNSSIALIDEFRPSNGTYVDGRNPFNALGCSVHWFMDHPTFKDGGLVAVGAYENGTRLLQVGPDGKLTEQGFFQPLGGSTSAPHWHPNGKVFYNIDYTRGVDVLRYTGDTYVPTGGGDVVPTPGATPGTNGQPPAGDQPACASAAGFRSTKVTPRGKTVTFGVDRREQQPFSVDVFQQSQGSTVVKERLVARFKNKSKGFKWNGTDRKKRKLKDGNYFVRFTMKQANGLKDVRRATLTRKGGKFRKAPDFYQRVDCGIFSSLKLSSSVFGGRNRVPLGISYKLNVPAKSVKIAVKVGSKTIKTFKGKGTKGKTVRFTLKQNAAKKGKTVKVVVTPDRGGQTTATVTLVAKRI